MSRASVITRATLLLLAFVLPGAAGAADADPRAVEVAERTMEAMGGVDAWRSARLLRFDFQVLRGGEEVSRYRHWWDRWTGDYRVEGTGRDGVDFLVLFDVDSPAVGAVWLDGEPASGEAADAALENAYGRFINDSYWLLMPWKWLDPGVHLAYAGERTAGGTTFDVVELSFDDGTGLTSNDRYWGWVSRESGLMERWQYLLQTDEGEPGSGDPTAWEWDDWEESPAGILLATVRRRVGSDPPVEIAFPVAEATDQVSREELDAIFRPKEPAE